MFVVVTLVALPMIPIRWIWQRHEFLKTHGQSQVALSTNPSNAPHWRAPLDSQLVPGVAPRLLRLFGEDGVLQLQVNLVSGDSRRMREEIDNIQRLFPESEVHWVIVDKPTHTSRRRTSVPNSSPRKIK